MNVPFMNNNNTKALRYECTLHECNNNTKTLRYECTLHE